MSAAAERADELENAQHGCGVGVGHGDFSVRQICRTVLNQRVFPPHVRQPVRRARTLAFGEMAPGEVQRDDEGQRIGADAEHLGRVCGGDLIIPQICGLIAAPITTPPHVRQPVR